MKLSIRACAHVAIYLYKSRQRFPWDLNIYAQQLACFWQLALPATRNTLKDARYIIDVGVDARQFRDITAQNKYLNMK